MIKLIKPKEREIIIQSLRGGVVPRLGLQHIQVGRSEELKSFIKDIDTVSEGGSSFRLVVGEYGSGKTFFLSLVRNIALEKGLVTINADLSPNKRLNGTYGRVRALISELVSSMSTRTKPDGNALSLVLDRFISIAREKAESLGISTEKVILEKLRELNEIPTGYTFSHVITKYWEAYNTGNDNLKEFSLKWLRGEYSMKKDAYNDLGVRDIIDDYSFFNILRLYAEFVTKAGYKGLLVNLDEMVNLYKLTGVSRKKNYEELLNILNNTFQGNVENIGFIMSGTPDFLTDPYRGLYSYEALKSRLAENSFSQKIGLVDYYSTVLRLENLTKEELFMLLKNIRHVFAKGIEKDYLLPDEALVAFMNHCSERVGSNYFRTPRNTIKGFIDLLSILEQYPQLEWSDMIKKIEVSIDVDPSELDQLISSSNTFTSDNDEDFASFRL